ncbi:MAG: hypothetical protein LBV65_04070 [Desulfovibrio sp.]|nr:hypothetical protein [Desulfovibrio sp.]
MKHDNNAEIVGYRVNSRTGHGRLTSLVDPHNRARYIKTKSPFHVVYLHGRRVAFGIKDMFAFREPGGDWQISFNR